jgi:hypothetical protein
MYGEYRSERVCFLALVEELVARVSKDEIRRESEESSSGLSEEVGEESASSQRSAAVGRFLLRGTEDPEAKALAWDTRVLFVIVCKARRRRGGWEREGDIECMKSGRASKSMSS